jgi:hypothetical protein
LLSELCFVDDCLSFCLLSFLASVLSVLRLTLLVTLKRFHYGSKVPPVTMTVSITILEQNRENSCQSSTKFIEVNVKNTFTPHTDKKKHFDIFVDFLIFIHFHYMNIHRLLSSLQRRNIFQQDLGIGIISHRIN